MKITFSFPDDIAERVCRRADRDEFVSRAVARALEQTPAQIAPPHAPSKWASLVEDIERQGGSLGEYAATFDRQRREFRKSFSFTAKP